MSEQPIDAVVRGLELETLDRDLFLGDPGRGSGRLFGGMVAAQSVMAAQMTVEEGRLHSIHAYFLRGGSYDFPIRFVVDRIRDGRTYTTRRVVALQGGRAIFNLSASFTRPEEGAQHQLEMPAVAEPESLPSWEELLAEMGTQPRGADHVSALEVRLPADPSGPAGRYVWMRPRGGLPDDPRLHVGITVFASDRTLAGTAVRPMGYERGEVSVTSLDHVLWLHREARFDDWILYVSNSPVGHAARGLALGQMYTREGVHFASVAQEGLIRTPRVPAA